LKIPKSTISKVCLDSSYLVALYDQRDVFHRTALAIQEVLEERGLHCLYLDCVLNEVLSVLIRRAGQRGLAPDEVLARLLGALPPSLLTWTYPAVPEWFGRCLGIMRETGWALNFHDALIVVAWQEFGFAALVSFDSDFDRVPGLRRLGSVETVRSWLAER